MDSKPGARETQEKSAVETIDRPSTIGISAIRGEDSKDSQSEDSDKDKLEKDKSDLSSSEEDPDMVDITIHPNPKGPEYLPSPEIEPISVKIPKEEDKEGKGPPKPPEGFQPGGIEGGG